MSGYLKQPPSRAFSLAEVHGKIVEQGWLGPNLSLHSRDRLDAVAAGLKNGRPRKRLGWRPPAERLSELLTCTSVVTDRQKPGRKALIS